MAINMCVASLKNCTWFGLFVCIAFLLQSLQETSNADEPQTVSGTKLRIVTYNIKRGLGNDGVTDLNRTGEVLHRLQADFVGLQEVDRHVQRSGATDQSVELGKQLAMQNAFGSFMQFQGGEYGLAVLSKYPITQSKAVELPEGNEPRVALLAEIALPSGESVMLVNVHFDWVEDDRFRFAQAQRLRKQLDELTMPYILLGDFNDQSDSRTVKLLSEGAIEAKKPLQDRLTFSSLDPSIEIDFIFAAPPSRWRVDRVQVIDEPVASDHRPVLAELTLMPSQNAEVSPKAKSP